MVRNDNFLNVVMSRKLGVVFVAALLIASCSSDDITDPGATVVDSTDVTILLGETKVVSLSGTTLSVKLTAINSATAVIEVVDTTSSKPQPDAVTQKVSGTFSINLVVGVTKPIPCLPVKVLLSSLDLSANSATFKFSKLSAANTGATTSTSNPSNPSNPIVTTSTCTTSKFFDPTGITEQILQNF